MGAVPERLQSGHGGCESGWGGGGFWRLEKRLGLALGYGNAFGAESVQWGGGYPPPLSSDSLGGGWGGCWGRVSEQAAPHERTHHWNPQPSAADVVLYFSSALDVCFVWASLQFWRLAPA